MYRSGLSSAEEAEANKLAAQILIAEFRASRDTSSPITKPALLRATSPTSF
jgi:hypothetical protein